MTRVFAIILVAWTAIACTAVTAWGQTQCGPYAAVVEGLAQNYGESRQAWGLSGDGQIMTIFANIDTGTWTLVAVRGMEACLVASGGNYGADPTGPGVEG